jgi:hypothetical protein
MSNSPSWVSLVLNINDKTDHWHEFEINLFVARSRQYREKIDDGTCTCFLSQGTDYISMLVGIV